MSIPRVLALEVNYDISKENLEKTINLKLQINKEKFQKVNEERKSNNLDEITLSEVQRIVTKGKVVYEDDSFNYKLQPEDKDLELADIIEPLLEIEIDYFKEKKVEFLHFCPKFNDLMLDNKFSDIRNEYFLELRKNQLKSDLGDKYEDVSDKESKLKLMFNTLLNQPLKQIEEIFLPAFCNNDESRFFSEVEEDYYKYLIYIPKNYLWDIPKNMDNEIVKVNSVEFKIRYLEMDEINEEYQDLINEEEYLNNLGKEILTEKIDLNLEKSFEIDWSGENLKQNNGFVQTHKYPRFVVSDNDEVTISQPGKTMDLLSKIYFGINNKFFDQKVKVIQNNLAEKEE